MPRVKNSTAIAARRSPMSRLAMLSPNAPMKPPRRVAARRISQVMSAARRTQAMIIPLCNQLEERFA